MTSFSIKSVGTSIVGVGATVSVGGTVVTVSVGGVAVTVSGGSDVVVTGGVTIVGKSRVGSTTVVVVVVVVDGGINVGNSEVNVGEVVGGKLANVDGGLLVIPGRQPAA